MKIFLRSLMWCGVATVMLAASGCSEPPRASEPPPLPSSVSSAAVTSSVSSTLMTTSSAASSSSAPSSSAVSSASPSSTVESSVADSSAVESSEASGAGEQISAQEAKDRKEIEAAWKGYWEISYDMQLIPQEDRKAKFSKYMTDPVLTELYDSSVINDSKHWANYGSVVFHIKWTMPVNGKDKAVMLDCQDQSGFGAYDTRTNIGFTYGPDRVNYNGTFVKTPQGWRLAAYLVPQGTTCDR